MQQTDPLWQLLAHRKGQAVVKGQGPKQPAWPAPQAAAGASARTQAAHTGPHARPAAPVLRPAR